MTQFIVTVSDEELKALEWDIYNVHAWIQNAISEKARRTMDILIEQNTSFNYKKISAMEKESIIRKLVIETAKERTKRLEKEIEKLRDE